MTTYRHIVFPLTLLAAGALGVVALHAGQRRANQARRLQKDGLEAWEDEGGNVDALPSEPAAALSGPSNAA
jgi:predicted membrane-bound mannosyltransferase